MEAHCYPTLSHMLTHPFELDDAGYKSVLYVFDSHTASYFIKIAKTLNTQHSFKYLIALRTFTISPDFCATILKAFHEIQPNRISLNLLAGDLNTRINKIEDKQVDFKGSYEAIENVQDRRENVRWFTKKIRENTQLENIHTDFVFSGLSDYALETARIYNSPILVMIDDYFNNRGNFKNNQQVMVSVRILIRETDNEALESLNLLSTRDRDKDCTICGTEDTVMKRIKELETSGVTDLLLHAFDDDIESVKGLHRLVKKYNKL